ncbi:DedA family protein [Quadrisphaera sp. INWT6]|uniref:DedA family protein n=1 Tax=Quadrisphaera sp. INWT6 TaxID=2596917 RepID=UPI0019D64824|nr:DedA family protein [Quadrisphaera sp. INWT6]
MMPLLASATTSSSHGLTGLSGWVADVMDALGWPGVFLLTLLETVFPPIPSEVVLPLGGFLAYQGRMGLVAVFLAATAGGVLGAVLLYELARRIGQRRAVALLAKMPLVDADDADAATRWFRRHGRSAVFFGRLIPGVRSLISLPAGAAEMPIGQFLIYTTAGTALWNALLIGGGFYLGSQWDRVSGYADVLDKVVIGAVVVAVALLVVRRVRKHRAAQRA